MPKEKRFVKIISEVGSVHDGSFGNAKHLAKTAKMCGADAVKFQTHIAEAETLKDAPVPPYFKGEPRYQYFQRTAFSKSEWEELKKYCEKIDIEFMSSPFSIEAAYLLKKIGMNSYKIPSGEITNIPMLEFISKTGKPIILSSGMSSWEELDLAVDTIRRFHNRITILQCTSEYPCKYESAGINVMVEMQKRYEVPVGLSDHSLTTYPSFLAVSLGASVIEKHLTFSRLMYGSDARHSIEPDEFKTLVEGIRAIEIMKNTPINKDKSAVKMRNMKEIFEKSIVSVQNIPKGKVICKEMLGMKKPGGGIPPKKLKEIIGKRAAHFIKKDSLIKEDDFI